MRLAQTRTRVKICGIVNSDDARVAIENGADALGFVFHEPSSRYISPRQAATIVRQLPAFVDAVGVVVDLDLRELSRIAHHSGIDCFQFHGDEPSGLCEAAGLPYLKALRVKPDLDLRAGAAQYATARGLLLDAFVPEIVGGTGTGFNWSDIPESLPAPVLVAGGLTSATVGQAIRIVRPYGVDVSSGVECAPGIKDPRKIREFLQAVHRADAQRHDSVQKD